jgi:hypothetical protein
LAGVATAVKEEDDDNEEMEDNCCEESDLENVSVRAYIYIYIYIYIYSRLSRLRRLIALVGVRE